MWELCLHLVLEPPSGQNGITDLGCALVNNVKQNNVKYFEEIHSEGIQLLTTGWVLGAVESLSEKKTKLN